MRKMMLRSLAAQFERASARYAELNGIKRDRDWFVLKMHEEIGELTQVWNKLHGRARHKGRSEAELRQDLADEAADLFGHIILFTDQNGLDLHAAIKRKWQFYPWDKADGRN